MNSENLIIDNLGYENIKLKVIFAITLSVLLGSLLLVINILSGGNIAAAITILIIFGIFYVYETNRELKVIISHPHLDHPEIIETIKNLAKKGGISEPEVILEDEDIINAYALSTLTKSYIILPKGTIENFEKGTLSKEDMESILGHEMGHIINKDSFITASLFSIIRLFDMIRNILEKVKPFIARMLKRSAEATDVYIGTGMTGWILLGITIFLFIILIAIIFYSISLFILISICTLFMNLLGRQREYIADLISAKLTGKPDAMAQALHTIHKIDIVDVPESMLSHSQSALLKTGITEMKDIRLGFGERLDELKSTHPNIINRVNLLISPKNVPNQLISMKKRIEKLDLKNIESKKFPMIRLSGIDINFENPLFHAALLGIIAGIIHLALNNLIWISYILFIIGGIWMGIFSISKPYSESFSSNSFNIMATTIFIFVLTYSFFIGMSTPTGFIIFYANIMLGMLIMAPISMLSAISITHINKRHVLTKSIST